MKLPTTAARFKIAGMRGTFSVSKHTMKMISGEEKYEGYWDRGNKQKPVFAYGFTREEALTRVLETPVLAVKENNLPEARTSGRTTRMPPSTPSPGSRRLP